MRTFHGDNYRIGSDPDHPPLAQWEELRQTSIEVKPAQTTAARTVPCKDSSIYSTSQKKRTVITVHVVVFTE